jgi:hypothetical protein
VLSPTPEQAASDPFWTGAFAASVALYLRGRISKRDLEATLRVFLRSPLVTPEMRAVLTRR